MRNKSMGGPMGGSGGDRGGGGSVEDRLARRFASELSRAEGDYPNMRWLAGREGGRSFRRSWPRLQAVLIAGATLTIVVLVAVSFAWHAGGGAAAGPGGSASADLVPLSSPGAFAGLVTNGLPAHLNGDPVVQLWQQDHWASDGGGFLLAGYKYTLPNPCSGTAGPAASGAQMDGQFIPTCDVVVLSPTPGNYTQSQQELAPLGAGLLAPIADGTAVVIRVHSHDPLATRCSAAGQAACDAALVVDSVAWQGTSGESTTPQTIAYSDPVSGTVTAGADGAIIDINGTHVYTAGETLPTMGAFLLSGTVTLDGASCGTYPGQSGPIAWPACGNWLVAGHQMTQTRADLGSLVGHTVVVRVYDAGSTTVCTSGESRCRVLAVVEILLVE